MKKFIYLLILFAITLSSMSLSYSLSPYHKAFAEPIYARVITDDTPFYKNPTDQTPLFYLPYTYYVKVLSFEQEFSHVECYGDGNSVAIDGYVPTSFLYQDGLEVKNPYVVLKLTTLSTAILYEDTTLQTQSQYIFADRELYYYGSFNTENGLIYYVGYNNRLGYIKESSVYPFSIPNHPNELTFLTPEQPDEPSQPTTQNDEFFGLKLTIILCLIFAGLIALFVALSKKTDKVSAISYYDENDYE